MKKIFACSKYEVLSLDGLRYETAFTHFHRSLKNTHLPYFENKDNLFVQVGNTVRRFVFKESIYGFRYYDDDGNLSAPWSAIVCELEGESFDCVILGRYSESRDCELNDFEYGSFNFWMEYPEIFFADRERKTRIRPGMFRVMSSCDSSQYILNDVPVPACAYDPEMEKILPVSVEVQRCSVDANGKKTIICRDIDEQKAFWDRGKCMDWCFKNFIVL